MLKKTKSNKNEMKIRKMITSTKKKIIYIFWNIKIIKKY